MRDYYTGDYTESTLELTRRERGFLIAIGLILIAVTITVCLILSGPARQEAPADTDRFPGGGIAVEGNLPGMSKEEILEQMQKEADENVFAFKINSRPVFGSGADKGTLRIENPGHNVYPFVVKIFLNETGEEIYNSGGIMPNYHIYRDTLTRALAKGEHAATAYIYAYSPDTNEYSGKVAVELTLIIKE